MLNRNEGVVFSTEWMEKVYINHPAVENYANLYKTRRAIKKADQAGWLVRAITVIDLTTLAGDDTFSNVKRYAIISLGKEIITQKQISYASFIKILIMSSFILKFPLRRICNIASVQVVIYPLNDDDPLICVCYEI